jgi:hypothetical protein
MTFNNERRRSIGNEFHFRIVDHAAGAILDVLQNVKIVGFVVDIDERQAWKRNREHLIAFSEHVGAQISQRDILRPLSLQIDAVLKSIKLITCLIEW